ncbi:class I adenylate-forming enzyme family protein [Fodinibius sp.]|uniref:class I adenylate-forming enzyme family protein n=1 Tax=Fodinibius sp. TaxID=1872440 RepID=UPI002ACD30D4|nr:class I adenylate-forming enzyme family protein [Fodinibius sp.]MDZ7660664.1 class I adenylate-forming enzyme family protein [Fodinibius sp.]
MDFQELQQKIDYARTTSNQLPPLSFQDIPELLQQRADNDRNYLTYIDENDNRTEVSYAEFYQHVLNCARLMQNHGLSHGDRIATISHNHWHTVVQYFAAWLLGLVVVPINLGEDDERIAYILENGEVELAFVRTEYRERFRGILESYKYLKNVEWIICEGETENFTKEKGDLELPDDALGESEALIVFTSGTTGAPKGVVLSQRNLLEDARSIADWHNIDDQTRMMCVLPIHHVNGTVVTLITPYFAGGSVVLNLKFRTSRFFPIIKEEEVHIVSVVPTLLQYLNNYYADKEVPGTSTLKHVICGAGPLTIKVAETFESRFGIPIIHGYGLSETTCYSCFLPVDLDEEEHQKWIADYGYPSIGVPIPANEMAIHDEDGNKLEEEERGEIVIRGVNVMIEYYNNREANEETFKNGWFRSGDEGFYANDEEGRPYFFITGRLKELIIRGGVNLAPLEIDEVINKAPGVKAGIAVGFENDWYGEEVGAYVELKEGAEEDEEAILEYCRDHLPFSKSPKVVVFGDKIPVTSTGKYQRRKVTHHFEQWKDVQFRKE